MIHEIGQEVQAYLRSKGCPWPVLDREHTETTTWGRSRVVIEHDPDASDQFVAPRTGHMHPKLVARRVIACRMTVYAQSTKAGALEHEHRRLCEHALDLCVAGLVEVVALRKNELVIGAGGFLVPTDLEQSEARRGSVYRLSFTVDRAIAKRNWDGSIGDSIVVTPDLIQTEPPTVTNPGV